MFIPKEMQKENKFEDVAIPSNKSFFARLGEVKPESLSYSGDEVVPEPMSKTESIEDYRTYAEEMARLDELEKNNAKK